MSSPLWLLYWISWGIRVIQISITLQLYKKDEIHQDLLYTTHSLLPMWGNLSHINENVVSHFELRIPLTVVSKSSGSRPSSSRKYVVTVAASPCLIPSNAVAHS
jgi:hypothetical protein